MKYILNILVNILISIILSVSITVLLFFTHVIQLLLPFFRKIRGTCQYSGENNGLENMNISELVLIFLFLISFIIITYARGKGKNKKAE